MRARWRAWTIRAAIVAVMSAIGVIAVASPAEAAAPAIEYLDVPPSVTIAWGSTLKVPFRIRMKDFGPGNASYEVKSSDDSKLACTAQCGAINVPVPAVNGDQTGVQVNAELTVKGAIDADARVTVTVRVYNGDGQDQQQIQVTISKPPTVESMKGQVVELLTANPVKGADVVVTDASGKTWDDIATGEDGSFIVPGPIVRGDVDVTVNAEGFLEFNRHYTLSEWDRPTGVRIPMVSNNSAAPTTTGAPSVTESLESGAGTTEAALPADEGGLSGFSLTIIIVGGLLVLLGIGGIVLLFIRKGEGGGPGGPGGRGKPGKGGPGGRGPVSPGRGPMPPGPRRPGPPDRTAPMRPGGPPRPAGGRDQTVISRSPLADNPTQYAPRPGAPARPPYGGPPQPGGYPPPAAPGGGYPPQGHPPQGHPQPGPPRPQQGGYPPQPGYPPQQGGYAPPGYPEPGAPTYGGPPPSPDPRQARPPRTEGRRVDWMDDY